MNPVTFTTNPPFANDLTAKNNIFALAERPWGKRVTIDALDDLFSEHLTRVMRKFPSPKLRTALETLIRRITTTFNNNQAKEIALFIRGSVLSMDKAPAQLDWHKCPPNILRKIFIEAIDSDLNFNSIQKVCKKWKWLSVDSWKKAKQSYRWKLAPASAELWAKANPDCESVDLTGLDREIQNSIFKNFPNLREIEINSLYFPIDLLGEFCPLLEKISIGCCLTRTVPAIIDFTKFSKLTDLRLDEYYQMGSLRLPSSIKEIRLLDGILPIEVNNTARIKRLFVRGGGIFHLFDAPSLDLSSPVWSELKVLSLTNLPREINIVFPKKIEKLQILHIRTFKHNNRPLELNLSESHKLESISIKRHNFSLKLPYGMPHLKKFSIESKSFITGEINKLHLMGSHKLKSLNLCGVKIKSMDLPNSIEDIKISKSKIDDWYHPGEYRNLKSISLSEVKGAPKKLSFKASNQLEDCFLKNLNSLEELQFPEANPRLKSLRLTNLKKIKVQGLKRDFQSLEKLQLNTEEMSGIESVDLRDAKKIKSVIIKNAPMFSDIKLPKDNSSLTYLTLHKVGLRSLNTINQHKLSDFSVRNNESCKVTMGKHPKLKRLTFHSEKPSTITAPAKKRKLRKCISGTVTIVGE